MSEIVIDPICILQMSAYYTKNKTYKPENAAFGLLYAQQVELKYKICMAASLATLEADNISELANEYERLRLKRSKETVNYYEEFSLIGCYVIFEQES